MTWTTQRTGLPASFWATDVHASPQTITTIWTVDSDGRVARSTDNANTWSLVTPIPVPVEIATIDVVSDAEAFVGTVDGLIFRTVDSGASWTRYDAPFIGPLAGGIVAPTSTTLIGSVKGGAAWATGDGGTTWSAACDCGDALRDIDAIDSGVLITSMSKGRINYSPDGGSTLTTKNVWSGYNNVRGVAMVDSSRFIAVGDNGSIAVTEDGGTTWTTRTSGTSEDLWDVDVTSEGVAIAVGAGGTILRSADFGWNWSVRASSGNDLRRIDARSGRPFIAAGIGGTIRRSVDGGTTWTSPASGVTENITSISVVSDLVAYAAAYEILLKSTDGGATWTNSSIPGFSQVAAATPSTVWIAAGWVGGWNEWAHVSTDGGATWSNPFGNNDPDVQHMEMLDDGTLYFGASGDQLRLLDPPATVPDYTAGAWGSSGSLFGACLQNLGGAAAVAAWTKDASGTCTANDADPWYAVPTSAVKIAQIPAPGTGTADVVWGFRASSGMGNASYSAGVVIEAIAPNV